MTRREWLILAGILLFAAVNLFWGISSGIPSQERLDTELGGVEVVEANELEISVFLRGNKSLHLTDPHLVDPELSRLSPFFDLLRSYHSDEQFTLKTLAEMVSRHTLEPGLYVYGQFYHYQIAAALAAGVTTGFLPGNLNVRDGMKCPDLTGRLYLSGRILLALMGLGGIVLLFFAARILTGSGKTALIAAALLATLPYYAMTAKVIKTEMPGCFWSLAVLLFAALAYRSGKWKYYLLAGVMLGLAVGSKYTCVFGAFLIAGFFLARKRTEPGEFKREFFALCCAGAVSFLTFSIVCFAWITDHATFLKDIVGTAGLASGKNKFIAFFDYLGCFAFDGFFFHIGPLLILLFGAAVLLAFIKPNRIALPLLPVIFCCFLLAASSGVPSSDRYALPALPLLCILGALLLTQIKPPPVRYAILGAVLATGVWYSIAIDIASASKNIRLTATEQIQRIAPAGSSIGRPQYPVSYRTAMLPFGKYQEYNEEEHPEKIAGCRFFIDSSYVYRMPGEFYFLRRLDWLFGRPQELPLSPGGFQVAAVIADPPFTLGRLIPGARYFTMDSYFEALSPAILLYEGRTQMPREAR